MWMSAALIQPSAWAKRQERSSICISLTQSVDEQLSNSVPRKSNSTAASKTSFFERNHFRQMISIQDNAWWWAVTVLITALLSATTVSTSPLPERPHIILIVADDLGWNDVSWHNKAVLMPNLQHLAQTGIILNSSYVLPKCGPTRSSLLTGRYPFTLGRQDGDLGGLAPTGLTVNATILPQALKERDYSTHIVGKWHLGYCSWDYTPTRRGFDTFYGFYLSSEDYFYHSQGAGKLSSDKRSDRSRKRSKPYDFRNNNETDYKANGTYSTYLFRSYVEKLVNERDPNQPLFLYLPFQSVHSPLEVPDNYTKPFKGIQDRRRRIKLGMIYAMDEAVGHMITALKASGHYDNSVIVFTTDNGGPTFTAGNNWPLRGNKSTLWEGGTRGPAFIHSPYIPNPGTVSNKLIHVSDWFATLVSLAGGELPEGIDGVDQWEALTSSAPSARNTMIYNIEGDRRRAAVRMGDFKLIVGHPGAGDWTPPPEGTHHQTQPSKHLPQHQQQPDFFRHPKVSPKGNTNTKRQDDSDTPCNINSNQDRTFQNRRTQVPNAAAKLANCCVEHVTLDYLLSGGAKIRLFNLTSDPEERVNLYRRGQNENVVCQMLEVLSNELSRYMKRDAFPGDPRGHPRHFNNTWTPGWCTAK